MLLYKETENSDKMLNLPIGEDSILKDAFFKILARPLKSIQPHFPFFRKYTSTNDMSYLIICLKEISSLGT